MAMFNFNDTIPTAPAGAVNVRWQEQKTNINSVSAYVPAATSALPGVLKLSGNGNDVLLGDGSWGAPTIPEATDTKFGGIKLPLDASKFLTGNGTWQYITVPAATTTTVGGLQLPGDASKFFSGDGTWQIITIPNASTTVTGGIKLSGDDAQFLAGDGSFKALPEASTTTAGTIQLEPTGDNSKFLSGDGTWKANSSSVEGLSLVTTTTAYTVTDLDHCKLLVMNPQFQYKAPSVVRNASVRGGSTTMTCSNPVTAGNFILAIFSCAASTTGVTSVTDNAGNVYTKLDTYNLTGASNICIWYAANVKAISTITVASSSTIYQARFIEVKDSVAIDTAKYLTAPAASGVLTVPTLTTANANELVFAIGVCFSGSNSFALRDTTGWTNRNMVDGTSGYLQVYSKLITAAATSVITQWNSSVSDNLVMVTLALVGDYDGPTNAVTLPNPNTLRNGFRTAFSNIGTRKVTISPSTGNIDGSTNP
jgi:hypothetical protein